jgi:hypothetical protein
MHMHRGSWAVASSFHLTTLCNLLLDKFKEITKDWNYDASCTVRPMSLPVWGLENFKHLIFVTLSVQK